MLYSCFSPSHPCPNWTIRIFSLDHICRLSRPDRQLCDTPPKCRDTSSVLSLWISSQHLHRFQSSDWLDTIYTRLELCRNFSNLLNAGSLSDL
ncbi:hypothetical protein RRG08_022665 [Elysia crispata]|uniref:Uncharacterized protein n=1 Tax=Elysia crispata TaxID=231223 RepID=A0AAE1D8J2_9GAST|nr:hypothetical protein RRG08_022665 [Elysia crispata]